MLLTGRLRLSHYCQWPLATGCGRLIAISSCQCYSDAGSAWHSATELSSCLRLALGPHKQECLALAGLQICNLTWGLDQAFGQEYANGAGVRVRKKKSDTGRRGLCTRVPPGILLERLRRWIRDQGLKVNPFCTAKENQGRALPGGASAGCLHALRLDAPLASGLTCAELWPCALMHRDESGDGRGRRRASHGRGDSAARDEGRRASTCRRASGSAARGDESADEDSGSGEARSRRLSQERA